MTSTQMTSTMALLVISLAAAGTYLLRLSFLYLMRNWTPTATLKRILRYIPPATLAALVLPSILLDQGELDLTLENTRMLAAACAFLVGWKTRSMLWVLASGMISLWVLQALPG